MTQRKKNLQPKKGANRQLAQRNRPRAARIPRGIPTHLIDSVCAVTDPFCEHAKGAKWTLDAAAATITYQSRAYVSLTTNANGYTYLMFNPHMTVGGFTYRGGSTLNPWTPAAANAGDSKIIAAIGAGNFRSYRVVSAGVRWWDTAAATGVGGGVTAIEFENTRTFNATTSIDFGDLGLSTRSHQFDRRKPGQWISSVSGDNGYKFIDISSAPDTDINAQNRTLIFLVFSGAATSVVAQAEMVINYEFKLDPDLFMSQSSNKTVVTAARSLTDHASTTLETIINPFFEGTREAFGSYVRRLASEALRKLGVGVGTAMGAYIGGPAGAVAGRSIGGYIMDVD